MTICYVCHSIMREVITSISGVEGVKAYACDKCGETVVDAEEARRIERLLKIREHFDNVSDEDFLRNMTEAGFKIADDEQPPAPPRPVIINEGGKPAGSTKDRPK